MSTTFLYRWFGIGRVPKRAMRDIEREGVLMLDEGLSATIRFRDFRAPGRRHGRKTTWCSGSLVLTQRRFWAFTSMNPIVSVPVNHPAFGSLEFESPSADVLVIRFDAGEFHDDWSGQIECRYRTPKAPLYLERLRALEASLEKPDADAPPDPVPRSQSEVDRAEWENPANWRGPEWAGLYFGKADSRLWVPKRIPEQGWTLNLGRPAGVHLLFAMSVSVPLLLVGAFVVVMALARAD